MVKERPISGQKSHILTVVIEDYFQVASFEHLIPSSYWERFESRLLQNTDACLSLLGETNNTATFFVCGWIADNHPELLRKIVEQGHEIGCQGYFHNHLDSLPREKFIEDVVRSKEAVERAIGKQVLGFRVAQGWLKEKDLWLLEALADLGFEYDSSLCRAGFQFSDKAFRGEVHLHRANGREIHEVPVSSTSFLGCSMPIAGGNYWRQFPSWPFQKWIKNWTNTHQAPLVSYFHIWELDPEQPKISAASPLQKLRHYRNLGTMVDKVRHYLDNYHFSSIQESLGLAPQQDIDIDTVDSPNPAKSGCEQRQKAQEMTLIVPCYNEEQTLNYLKNTLDRFEVKSAGVFALRYIFVDDGSKDGTWDKLNSLFPSSKRCLLLQHDKNKGIASALVTGFAQVQTDLLAVIDADCTFSPEQLLDMMPLLTPDVDVVTASPMHQQGSMQNVNWFRGVLSKGAAVLHRSVLHHKLTSYTSCFRLYRKKAINNMQVRHMGFCGVTEILARIDLAGFRVVEYPALLEVRLLGASKINVIGTVMEHLVLVMEIAIDRWFKAKKHTEAD